MTPSEVYDNLCHWKETFLVANPTFRDVSEEALWSQLVYTYNSTHPRAILAQLERIDFEAFTLSPEDAFVYDQTIENLRKDIDNPRARFLINYGNEQWINRFQKLAQILSKFLDIEFPNRWPEITSLAKNDVDPHKRLCADLDEAHSSLIAQNWKAATVVSASVMEALLAWWLSAIQVAVPNGLAGMIDTAAKAPNSLFDPPATMDPKYDRSEAESRKGAAMCAANYRNLIHAEKAERLKATCSRASAWQTFGATLMVAEAIGRKL